MNEFLEAYLLLSEDEKFCELTAKGGGDRDGVTGKAAEKLAVAYDYVYRTIYLRGSFAVYEQKTEGEDILSKRREFLRQVPVGFRNRLSDTPHFNFYNTTHDMVCGERRKNLIERPGGTYITDNCWQGEERKVFYPYLEKLKVRSAFAFFGSEAVEQPSTFLCRFYFNAMPSLFYVLLMEIAGELNMLGLPFTIKYFYLQQERVDNTVLYVLPKYANLVYLVIENRIDSWGRFVRKESPRFTCRLYDGIAFGESPRNGQSFGAHRSRVLSDMLLNRGKQEFGCGRQLQGEPRDKELSTYISEQLRLHGINGERGYLNSFSRPDNYLFLS